MPPAQVVAGPRVTAGEGAGRCHAAFSAGRLDLSPCGEEFSPLCVLERIGGAETRITRSHPIPFPNPGQGVSSPQRASKSRCLGREALRGALGALAQVGCLNHGASVCGRKGGLKDPCLLRSGFALNCSPASAWRGRAGLQPRRCARPAGRDTVTCQKASGHSWGCRILFISPCEVGIVGLGG